MFGIGTTEILVILVVALIVIGPESLPKIARTIGKAMGEFRKVSTEFQRTLNTEIALEEHAERKKEAEEELFGDKKKQKEASTLTRDEPPIIRKEDSTSEENAPSGDDANDKSKKSDKDVA